MQMTACHIQVISTGSPDSSAAGPGGRPCEGARCSARPCDHCLGQWHCRTEAALWQRRGAERTEDAEDGDQARIISERAVTVRKFVALCKSFRVSKLAQGWVYGVEKHSMM